MLDKKRKLKNPYAVDTLKSLLHRYWKWLLALSIVVGLPTWYLIYRAGVPKRACKEIILKLLDAPATAQFVSVEILEDEEKEDRHYYFGHVVVDAQNQYGALLRKGYCVIVYQEQHRFYSTGMDGIMDCKRPPLTYEERAGQKELIGWK